EDFLGDEPPPERAALLRELLRLDLEYRRRRGERPSAADYEARFPGDAALVRAACGGAGGDADCTPWEEAPAAAGPAGRRPPTVPEQEVLAGLGRGGFGVVYRARQVKLNRLVALKMVLAGAHAGEEGLARFRAEAEAVARLQHPNIVQVFEVGEADSHPY